MPGSNGDQQRLESMLAVEVLADFFEDFPLPDMRASSIFQFARLTPGIGVPYEAERVAAVSAYIADEFFFSVHLGGLPSRACRLRGWRGAL